MILKKINGHTIAGKVLEEIKQTSKEKTEKLFTYGVTVIVIGIMLSVFQQAIGINAVLYFAHVSLKAPEPKAEEWCKPSSWVSSISCSP